MSDTAKLHQHSVYKVQTNVRNEFGIKISFEDIVWTIRDDDQDELNEIRMGEWTKKMINKRWGKLAETCPSEPLRGSSWWDASLWLAVGAMLWLVMLVIKTM